MTIENLNRLLNGVPSGAVPPRIVHEVFKIVEASWREFSGSDDTSMEAWKISRDKGPEEVTWSPPYLSFTIDRHGGTVLGSTRAERQRWTLNLEARTAEHSIVGFRQLRPNAPKLDVKGLADDVCKAVQEGPASRLVSDGVIVWKNDELIIFHAKIVGGTYQRTVSGRRKRFIRELEPKMAVIGWTLVSSRRKLTFKKTM